MPLPPIKCQNEGFQSIIDAINIVEGDAIFGDNFLKETEGNMHGGMPNAEKIILESSTATSQQYPNSGPPKEDVDAFYSFIKRAKKAYEDRQQALINSSLIKNAVDQLNCHKKAESTALCNSSTLNNEIMHEKQQPDPVSQQNNDKIAEAIAFKSTKTVDKDASSDNQQDTNNFQRNDILENAETIALNDTKNKEASVDNQQDRIVCIPINKSVQRPKKLKKAKRSMKKKSDMPKRDVVVLPLKKYTILGKDSLFQALSYLLCGNEDYYEQFIPTIARYKEFMEIKLNAREISSNDDLRAFAKLYAINILVYSCGTRPRWICYGPGKFDTVEVLKPTEYIKRTYLKQRKEFPSVCLYLKENHFEAITSLYPPIEKKAEDDKKK